MFEDLDLSRPDAETQLLKRIRKIDDTLFKSVRGLVVCNERTLTENKRYLTQLHWAHFGNH